jgi:hypothetical protein
MNGFIRLMEYKMLLVRIEERDVYDQTTNRPYRAHNPGAPTLFFNQ